MQSDEIIIVNNLRHKKNKIIIIIVGTSLMKNEEIKYAINPNTLFENLINLYCEKYSINPNNYLFITNATKITGNLTPNDLNMKNGDFIDVIEKS